MRELVQNLLGIFFLGGLGALGRYSLGFLLNTPWATLVCNLIGSFFIGYISEKYIPSPHMKLILMVGLLGGFTTFSSYAIESLKMVKEGQWLFLFFYMSISNLAGIWFCYFGTKLAN